LTHPCHDSVVPGCIGVKTGAYYHRDIQVIELKGDGDDPVGRRSCIAYFYPAKEELLAIQPYLANYGDAEHAVYLPRAEVNQEILKLMKQPMHGLQSPVKGHPMQVHVLRLLPGVDLLQEIKAFVRERALPAVVVLACVGSTGKTTLRPAGVPTPMVFEGKFEICSLTGTLSSHGGHHIHMGISDHECRAFGGHVLEGCIVRTTAEITLGEIEGCSFLRPTDTRTGYDELSISSSDGGASSRQTSEEAGVDTGAAPVWQNMSGCQSVEQGKYKRARGDLNMWHGKVALAQDQSRSMGGSPEGSLLSELDADRG